MIFSAPIKVKCLQFSMEICVTNEQQFYNYFVGLSVIPVPKKTHIYRKNVDFSFVVCILHITRIRDVTRSVSVPYIVRTSRQR